jgi:hypothetical protein
LFAVGMANVSMTIQGRPLLVPAQSNVGEKRTIATLSFERVEP